MRKTPLLLALCGCMSATPLYASFEFAPTDPRGLAMAGALAAVPGDAFGMRYNPAAPSLSKGIAAGAAYHIPYGKRDLSSLSGAVTWSNLPFDHDGSISASAGWFAPNGYREQTVSAGYSRTLTSSIHAGLSVTRNSLAIDGLPDRSANGINAGVMAELRPGLIVGITSCNLNSPTIDGGVTTLPRTTLAGFSYRFENGNMLTADAQADPDRPGRALAAGEFRILPSMVVMMGVGTNPSVISAGTGIEAAGVRATGAVSRNIDLGTTAAFGLEVKL
jgi:hypothetical protein